MLKPPENLIFADVIYGEVKDFGCGDVHIEINPTGLAIGWCACGILLEWLQRARAYAKQQDDLFPPDAKK